MDNIDPNIKGVEGEQKTPPEENKPASEQKTGQETDPALSQTDFPEEQDAQKKAFYSMRKKIDDLEGKLANQQDDLDLVNMARGTPNQEGPFNPNYQAQGNSFDTSDPATQAFLDEAQKAKQEAISARQAATAAQAQMEDFEAWSKYPKLNPKSPDRDKTFSDDVQRSYVAERLRALNAGKAPPRLVEVAEQVEKRHEEIRTTAKEQALAESKATMEQKQNATLESQGTQVDLSASADEGKIEALRARVRRGDDNALMELNKLTDPYISSIPDDAPF